MEGVILTHRLHERTGLACVEGDTLCEIGDVRTLLAEVLLDERLLGMLDAKAGAEIRPSAMPGRVTRGPIETVALGPSVGGKERMLYRVLVRVPNADGRLHPGMTGQVRFGAGRVPLLVHLWGGLTRVLRIEFWI